MTVDEIIAGLLDLNAAEVEQVRLRCMALKSLGIAKPGASRRGTKQSKASEREAADIDIVLDQLAAFMKERGADFSSVEMIKRTSGFKSFEAKLPSVLMFFAFAKTKVERNYMIALAIDLLYKDMRRMGISSTLRTMMAQFHRIPAVCEAAFPGYYQAGMMHVILRKAQAAGEKQGAS